MVAEPRGPPHGTVEVRGRRCLVVASEVEEPECARLWAALSARFDGYDGYQAKVSPRRLGAGAGRLRRYAATGCPNWVRCSSA